MKNLSLALSCALSKIGGLVGDAASALMRALLVERAHATSEEKLVKSVGSTPEAMPWAGIVEDVRRERLEILSDIRAKRRLTPEEATEFSLHVAWHSAEAHAAFDVDAVLADLRDEERQHREWKRTRKALAVAMSQGKSWPEVVGADLSGSLTDLYELLAWTRGRAHRRGSHWSPVAPRMPECYRRKHVTASE